jgi:zinc protease
MKKILILFVSMCLSSGFAQDLDLNASIPLDKDVKTGKLKNGLTYYIKKNKKPENKVDLRLVVNAGSILETDKQQGLAHYMEHMCFNGTKRFPKNTLVDYLQSIGVQFGMHLNAYTSFDETVYFLPIPSDDKTKLKKGFEILEDWAFNTTLTKEEIAKEKGIILEELRMGQGADQRMREKYLPKIMNNALYAERLPIGKKEILETFKDEEIIKFYKDWYRPNLMAVIVVGDIEVNEMEKMIEEHFGSYQNPKNAPERKIFELPNHKNTLVAIETDKEATSSSVEVYYKENGLPKITKTIGDYKTKLADNLFSSMINARLDELANSSTPPYSYAYSFHGGTWARSKEAFQSFAMSSDGKQLEALKVVLIENERVKRHGFTETELERAKKEFMSYIEKAYKEKDKSNSNSFVSSYQGHFLENSPAPGIEFMYNMSQKMLPTITLKEVNALIKDYIKEENRVIVLTAPEKEGVKKPTEAEVLALLDLSKENIEPYQDKAVAQSIVRNPIAPGKILKKESNDKIGTKTLHLSNGATVIYKKTDFKNDEILFNAISIGGMNLYDDATYKKVQFAMNGLAEAGYSGLSQNDLTKFMSGKIANLNAFSSSFTDNMNGSCSPKDLETFMQMIYANFTDVNLDKAAFEGYKTKQNNFFGNMKSNPMFFFQNELMTYLNSKNPRYNGMIPDEKTWNETDYELAHKIYKERFSNASDFTFLFVGNVEDQQMETFATNYLAALPGNNTKEKIKDLPYRMIKGDLKKVVNTGKDPKANVRIMFYGDCTYDKDEAMAMQALGEILSIKLIEEVREKESGVYSIRAGGSINKLPSGSYSFNINFPCAPDSAERLAGISLKELQKIIDNGPDEKELNKFKEAEKLEYKKKIKENKYWMDNFNTAVRNESNPENILTYQERVTNVTAKQVQEVAKKYLSKDKTIAIQLPEVQ